jgi:hypothetical protein
VPLDWAHRLQVALLKTYVIPSGVEESLIAYASANKQLEMSRLRST